MWIWKEMFVVCLKADLVAIVEAEKKEQLLTQPTLEHSTVTAYEEMELVPTLSLNSEWW
jgi:hypothetical protein